MNFKLLSVIGFSLVLMSSSAMAGDIRIGNTGPYSGPLASYSRVLKTIDAYFKMINKNGGVNGKMIEFISYDDMYEPAKTIQQVRNLVEIDHVLFTLFTIGTPSNLAARQYMNDRKVPQLFVGSGAYLFNQPTEFPWTNPGVADYKTEAALYAKHLMQNHAQAKIGVLYQNDDYGKLYLEAFLKEMGDKAKDMVVLQMPYNLQDADLHSQMKALKDSGADTLVNISTPRFAIQSIEIMTEMNWKPLHVMSLPVASRENVFAKVGFDKVQGVLTAQITKDPASPMWSKDADMIAYKTFMKASVPDLDPNDVFIVTGYMAANMTVEILKKCGDDLSPENIIKVRNQLNYSAPMLLPGLKVELSATDLRLVKDLQIVIFEGKSWRPFKK